MKSFLVSNILFITLVLSESARNNYLWGKIGGCDTMISKETVSKSFIFKEVVEKKYVFKQDPVNSFTITAIRINDKKKTNGATAKLMKGGPGFKDATIIFRSQLSCSIKNEIEVWARPT